MTWGLGLRVFVVELGGGEGHDRALRQWKSLWERVEASKCQGVEVIEEGKLCFGRACGEASRGSEHVDEVEVSRCRGGDLTPRRRGGGGGGPTRRRKSRAAAVTSTLRRRRRRAYKKEDMSSGDGRFGRVGGGELTRRRIYQVATVASTSKRKRSAEREGGSIERRLSPPR